MLHSPLNQVRQGRTSNLPVEPMKGGGGYVRRSMMKKEIYSNIMKELYDSMIYNDITDDENIVTKPRPRILSETNSPNAKTPDGGNSKGGRAGIWRKVKDLTIRRRSVISLPPESSGSNEQLRNRRTKERPQILYALFEENRRREAEEQQASWYSSTCSDNTVPNDEIIKQITSLPALPEKWQLCLIYWRFYLNQAEIYIGTTKYLIREFYEVERRRRETNHGMYDGTWEEYVDVMERNFINQTKHVTDIFSKLLDSAHLSSDRMRDKLQELRRSWMDITLRTKDDCICVNEASCNRGQRLTQRRRR
ncbi:hypothetical protein C922_05830 [Plasmodium inui San Antonio 1]|uniref:Plasmodium RESA N-terminal domain-containing protein n=1 Tax=Plasmodium inui San Antonio 1 TaxID=1237626 RepID=W7A3Y1_9APIC|nr:hypothetical protein C922_05830 [Plasmodium inui San Antonio 1]EUD63789.1 hypothetical protein C922_05830 [Plasmodium inui San Antonio 1]